MKIRGLAVDFLIVVGLLILASHHAFAEAPKPISSMPGFCTVHVTYWDSETENFYNLYEIISCPTNNNQPVDPFGYDSTAPCLLTLSNGLQEALSCQEALWYEENNGTTHN